VIRVRSNRIVCAALVAALHAGALMQLGSEVLTPPQIIIERKWPEHRALLVTAFMSEEQARGAPRFVALTAADIVQTVTAIVLPLPQLPDIHPVAADSFERSREIADSEDVAKAERLQGLYVGQIKARLRRVLERVRDFNSAHTVASCVMYVVQNERGQVLDVMSDECDADAQWQRNVETAIRQASPLPLPPEGLAMGSYLTLDLSTLQ
jgi:TonB C terminal